MVEERIYVPRNPGLHILAAVSVSLAVMIVALWLMGVIEVSHPNGGPVVITVDISKAEQASKDAADKTGRALEHAGEKLQQEGE